MRLKHIYLADQVVFNLLDSSLSLRMTRTLFYVILSETKDLVASRQLFLVHKQSKYIKVKTRIAGMFGGSSGIFFISMI